MIGSSRSILESPLPYNNDNHYHHYNVFENKIKGIKSVCGIV
jgi:hypothetical protein